MTTPMLREGGAPDASTITDIHMRSWQTAYRGFGVLSDAYLDGVVNTEMHAKRYEHTTAPVTGQYVQYADLDGETTGFLYAMREDNTSWGAFVDNPHLLPTPRGHSVGRRLMGEAARWAVVQGITQLHLLAYEMNTTVTGFYKVLDGASTSRDWLKTADGGHAWVRTYHWPEAESENLTCLP